MDIGCGILAVWNDCAPGEEAGYEAWYLGEHLIERLSIPGFRWGRRYRRIAGASEALPEYMTYYEVDTPDVLNSDAYRARLNDPTPETRRIMTTVFQNMNRTICRRTFGAGAIRGGYAVAAVALGEAMLSMRDVSASAMPLLWCEGWQSAEPAGQDVSQEEALRGGDSKINACALVECPSADEAFDVAAKLEASVEVVVSVYQLTGSLHASDLGSRSVSV